MSIWFVYVCLTDTLIGNGVNWFLRLDGAKPSLSLNFPVCSEDSIPVSVREVSPTRLGLPCAKTWLQLEDWDFGTQVKVIFSLRFCALFFETMIYEAPCAARQAGNARSRRWRRRRWRRRQRGPAAALNEAVVRRTQDSLGRVIRKPPLRDRLLSKPPFRYLHAVIPEVIRVTGFMKGLYTDFELKSDNVKEEAKQIPVDQLGQKVLEKKGVSWNKKYRKQYGALQKYLQNHPQIFQFSPDENKVGLKAKHKLPFKSDSRGQDLQSPPQKSDVQWNSEKEPTRLRDSSAGCHWFDLNGSKVHPIKEKDIEKQFQGKESAYMLFYRKSPLKRAHEARGNARYQIPEHLLNEMNAANTELQKKRAECDSANNGIDLHLHLSSCYKFHHGALHPSRTWKESVVDLTIDRRKTLGELRQSVSQMLESWEGDLILSIAKPLPAGLHLYQILDGGELTLDGVGLADGADIFVSNGKEVEVFGCLDKICCRSGNHCMRLTVLREDEGRGIESASVPLGSDGCKFSHAPKTRKVHLKDMTVRIYIELPKCNLNIVLLCTYMSDCEVSWQTAGEGKLDFFLIVFILTRLSLIQIVGEEETLMQIKDDHFQAAKCFEGLEKDMKAVLHSICQSCVEETNKQTKSKQKNPLTLMKSFVMVFLKQLCDNWHWRRIDWCYEAGEASQENATLKELNVCRGDTLVITEGKLPAKGFLKIPVWWLKPSSHKKHGENAQDQVNGMTCKMDALQVSPAGGELDRFLKELIEWFSFFQGGWLLKFLKKCFFFQAMTLPCCPEQIVPLPSFLRAWTVDSKRPGKLLRNNKQRLNDYKLGARVEICIGALQKEEHLGPQELLLRVQMGIPGERDYYGSTALVWDISKECTTWALRQRVASHYGLPVDKIEIAKYFPERLEWLPISSWTQQMSKRKRKKKQESLQSAPYHLKDGDIIGVKNLLLDDTKDFSTVRDDVGKEKQRQLALGKKKSRQAERLQEPVFSEEKLNIKHCKPEVALSINVGVFR
ncbi:LOW QUALITY PROTEIN: ubiquitin carboxyl-terminal hydrolase 40-like [Sarcoramphus papa]